MNWAAESRVECIEDGMVKCKAEERREIAMPLLQQGLSVEQIVDATELSVEEVRQSRCEQWEAGH